MLNMSGLAQQAGQGAGGGTSGMSLQQLLSMLQGTQTATPGGQGGGGIGANTSTPMSNYMAPYQSTGMPHQQTVTPMATGAQNTQPANNMSAMTGGTGNLMQLLSTLKNGQTGIAGAGGPSAGQVGQIAQGMNPDTMAAQMSSNAPIGQAGSPTAALAAPVNTGQGTGSTGTPNGMNPGLWDWLQKQMSGLGGGGAGGMMSGGGGGL